MKMPLLSPNPVNKAGTSGRLSTGAAVLGKLSKLTTALRHGLHTVFGGHQVVEITVENSLVHTKRHGLSTTTIEI
jgi:hypothetical protein